MMIRRALTAALVFMAVSVGAVAAAAIPDSGGVIHACYKLNAPDRNSLRVVDTEAGQTCPAGWAPLNWNQTGPAGPAGAPGAGLTQVQTVQNSIDLPAHYPSARVSLSAYCPSGTVATGGGGWGPDTDDVGWVLEASMPVTLTGTQQSGWNVMLQRIGAIDPNASTAFVYVLCAS